MATRNITDLPVVGTIQDDDTLHINQSSIDKRGTFRFVKDQILIETQTLVDQAEDAKDAAQSSKTSASNSASQAATSADKAASAAVSVVRQPLVAHGAMFEPVADNDFTCPATVANQFIVNARQYRVGDVIVDLPQTTVTLTPAPSTAAQLTRRDIIYLREDGTVGTFTGVDDASDMATAGFSDISTEDGLWQDVTGYAVPLCYVQR